MDSGLLDGLNEEQLRAVCHQGGPLLVLAGPGSGKTRVITRRVAYRIQSGAVDERRVLAITFTNRAAQEMKDRISTILGQEAQVRIGTFHWMCSALLRRHVHLLGLRRDFRLLGPAESRRFLGDVLRSPELADLRSVRKVGAALSARKNGVSPETIARVYGVGVEPLDRLRAAQEAALRRDNALDLDDLLALSVRLLQEDVEVRRRCRARYDEILVDEYQDVNPVQHDLLTLLFPASRHLIAVGDEDQAIYGWRAADLESVLRFPEAFLGASLVKLETTYRSTKRIVRAARALVAHNRHRTDKALRTSRPAGERPVCYVAVDEMEEADWIASEIRAGVEREGRCWADFAVLYRLNAQSRALEDAFVRRGMPYRIRGAEPFYDRPEIRTALAYLHLALDREDDVALALLLGGVPGIGPKRLEDMRQMAASRGVSLFDFVAARPNTLGLPDAVASRVAELSGRIGRVQGRRAAPLLELVEYAIEATEADASLLRSDEEAVRDNLLELVSVAQEHVARRGTLRTFLDITALDPDRTAPRSGISCMTLHGAKGLEFPVVYIAGLEEGLLPHGRSLDREADVEEERRLCYVGMTRAQDRLGLSYARARLLGGQALIGHASRFVGEIGAENVTIRVSPTLKTKPRLLTVRPGERVVHPRWQTGTVLEVEGRGRDTVVTIHFDGAGRQRLQLCHAPLRPVGEGRRGDLAG